MLNLSVNESEAEANGARHDARGATALPSATTTARPLFSPWNARPLIVCPCCTPKRKARPL